MARGRSTRRCARFRESPKGALKWLETTRLARCRLGRRAGAGPGKDCCARVRPRSGRPWRGTLTNCYVIGDADGGTVVDACFPSTGDGVVDLLATLGRTPADIRVLLPTHGHFDHVGFVRGLKATLGTPIWIHRTGAALAAHPYRYRPQRNRLLISMGHGRSLPILGRMVLTGALAAHGVDADEVFADGDVLHVPGRPHVSQPPAARPSSARSCCPVGSIGLRLDSRLQPGVHSTQRRPSPAAAVP